MHGYAFKRRKKSTTTPKKYVPPPQEIEARIVWHEDGPELFIPIVVHAQHGYARASWEVTAEAKHDQMLTVLAHLRTKLHGFDKSRIAHIDYTRISIGEMDEHDNLPWAMKHIVDIVSYWILDGSSPVPFGRIGRFDDRLKQMGKTWTYHQTTNDYDSLGRRPRKKCQGIALRFRHTYARASPT